jgi:hypothetical protein
MASKQSNKGSRGGPSLYPHLLEAMQDGIQAEFCGEAMPWKAINRKNRPKAVSHDFHAAGLMALTRQPMTGPFF